MQAEIRPFVPEIQAKVFELCNRSSILLKIFLEDNAPETRSELFSFPATAVSLAYFLPRKLCVPHTWKEQI